MAEGVDHCAGRNVKPEPFRRRLVIMVKEPIAGRVKTRLACEIGAASALRFYRANMRAVVCRLAADPRWQTILSVAPPTAVLSRHLPSHLPRVPQVPGDIGTRMEAALAHPLGARTAPGPVVLIGSDIATVRPDLIAAAFRRLARSDVVFGPAVDGGFWLVGLRRAPALRPALSLHPVAWSTPATLARCLDALASRAISFADTLSDTDTAADLARLGPASGRRILPK